MTCQSDSKLTVNARRHSVLAKELTQVRAGTCLHARQHWDVALICIADARFVRSFKCQKGHALAQTLVDGQHPAVTCFTLLTRNYMNSAA